MTHRDRVDVHARWAAVAAAALISACSLHGPATTDTAVVIDAPQHVDAAAIDADLSAPTDTPYVPCTGSAADIYAATVPAGTAPGTILACAPDPVLALADVQSGIGSAMVATSAVKQYRVAYATRDGAGGVAVTSARVYLPSTPRARPVPLAVVGHGSVGLADMCASSMTIDDAIALPYAGRGFAAIFPDLSGLGNAGTQDYLNNRQQGEQMLDGVRALRAILPPGLTAQSVVLTGYSQGGGAALSAQSMFRTDGADLGTLVATAVYAPEWPIRLNSFRYLDILNAPSDLTVEFGVSFPPVAVLRQYAYWEDHIGVGMGKTTVASDKQSGLETAVQGQCLVAFGGYVESILLHASDLFLPTLTADFLACVNNGSSAQCTNDVNVSAYYQFLIHNLLTGDPMAGPVLMLQGGLDVIMPPASEGSCVHDKLIADGVAVSTCMFSSLDHETITNNHSVGVAWTEAALDGNPLPACSDTTFPTCTP